MLEESVEPLVDHLGKWAKKGGITFEPINCSVPTTVESHQRSWEMWI